MTRDETRKLIPDWVLSEFPDMFSPKLAHQLPRNNINDLTMSAFGDDELIRVEAHPAPEYILQRGIHGTGPYTNCIADRDILREALKKECDNDPNAVQQVNDLLDSEPWYNGLHNKTILDAQGASLFEIKIKKEKGNKEVVDAIRAIQGEESRELFAVRTRAELGVGDCSMIQTFGSKDAAVANAKFHEKFFGASYSEDYNRLKLDPKRGVLVGTVTGNYGVKCTVTVTKVLVSGKFRRDVYDLVD